MIVSKWCIMFMIIQLSGIIIGLLTGYEYYIRNIGNSKSESVPVEIIMINWVGLSFVALVILLLAHIVFGWDTSAYSNPF